MDKKALYSLSYGVFMLSTKSGDTVNGCITNTCIQVANSPTRIAISVINANYTCELIKQSGVFAITLLDNTCNFYTIQHFGFQSGRNVNKFDGYAGCRRVANGTMAVTAGTNAYVSAYVQQQIDLGSHMLFIAQVTDGEILNNVPSATYAYYFANIKPKPEAVGKTPEGKTVWRCKICGYEYVGEELPEDFICPLCKHPASDFEKMTL